VEEGVLVSTTHPLVGRRVRLTGHGWDHATMTNTHRGQLCTIGDVDDNTSSKVVVLDTGHIGWIGLPYSMFGVELLPTEKRTIYVSSWVGGFSWYWSRENALADVASDERRGDCASVAVEIRVYFGTDGDVTQEQADAVTDFIDGELQDAIAMGLVGKIIARTTKRPDLGADSKEES
jgi:hypothetical protein